MNGEIKEELMDELVESKLEEAVKSETPDIIDDLLSEIEQTGQENNPAEPEAAAVHVTVNKESHRAGLRSWYKGMAALAAVLLLFVGARSVFRGQNETFAVVGLDVNPSVELSVNRSDRVIAVNALNNEGSELINEMDLKGSDINVACNALIGSMLTHGYLTSEMNSMLVSVRAEDSVKGRELEQELSEKLNQFMENSEVAAAIIGQYVEDDEALEAFAEKHNISLGKALLIRKLLASGSNRMSESALLKLSTQELILLGQQRKVQREDSYGKADTSKYIGKNKAIKTAVKHAGFTRDQVTNAVAEFDCDDGVIVYEVEFTAGGIEYEYDIDAETGKIISHESESGSRSSSAQKKHSDDNDDDNDDDRGDDDRDDDDDDRDDDDDDDDDD